MVLLSKVQNLTVQLPYFKQLKNLGLHSVALFVDFSCKQTAQRLFVFVYFSGELPSNSAHPAPITAAPIQRLLTVPVFQCGQRGGPELMQPLEGVGGCKARSPAHCSHGDHLHGQRPDAAGEGQADRGADPDAAAEAEAGGDLTVPAGAGQDGRLHGGEEGGREQNDMFTSQTSNFD